MEYKLDWIHYVRHASVEQVLKIYNKCAIFVCASVEEVLDAVKDYDDNDIYVIGGGEIYKEFLPYCDVAHITKIDYKYDADTYLENLDKNSEWHITANSEEKTYFDIVYEFVKYEKKK